jgi:alkylation response protein AidB-like acyl-CoA dehydrogenase
MRFELDEAQRALYERFRRLGEAGLSADVVDRDKVSRFSHADWEHCAEHGVQGLLLPTEYGGGGHSAVEYVSAMEGLGHGCPDNGLLMSLGAHILAVEVPILAFGDEDQRVRYLPRLAAGTAIGANAMTEPGTGSDALALTTTAERAAGGYRLTGRKCYVTNAPVADVFVVYATVDPELGFTGVTAFLVERDDGGLSVVEGEEKLGLRTAPWGVLELDGCFVPNSRVLGAVKQGAAVFARSMAWERALLMAPWLGVLRRETAECVGYSRRRRQFGKHIGHFQSVSHRLVDLHLREELCRMVTYRAAHALTTEDAGYLPEMSKLYTSEAVVEAFTAAGQIYGALGYTAGSRVERNLRDAIGMTISSGTSDLQRKIIAGRLGLSWPERY